VTDVLTLTQVSRRFGDRTVVRDVTLHIATGSVLALIGPNGAGKTTLLSLLAGTIPPSDGRREGPAAGVALVPQRAAAYRRLTARENLALFAGLSGVSDRESAIDAALEATGLRDIADRPIARLSAGQQQRASIAAGLVSPSPVLLLDEPTAALDPHQRDHVWEAVRAARAAGRAVVFTTQLMTEIAEADTVMMLDAGNVVFTGSVEQFVAVGGDPEASFAVLAGAES